ADLKGWKGSASHAGWTKVRNSVDALVRGEESSVAASAKLRVRDRLEPLRWWVAAALLLVALAAGLFFYFDSSGSERKPVLAVLPFRSLDSHDASLVAGIWEDTRQVIGRNPQLVVLGPNTAQQLAQKG